MLSLLFLAATAPASIADALQQAIDPCPADRPSNAIVVCRRRDEQERYRMPPMPDQGFDPLGSVDSVSRERQRLLDADGLGQDLTRGSCSTVGASGSTGCMIKTWRERDQQKGW